MNIHIIYLNWHIVSAFYLGLNILIFARVSVFYGPKNINMIGVAYMMICWASQTYLNREKKLLERRNYDLLVENRSLS